MMEQYMGIHYEQHLRCFARPSFLSKAQQETSNIPIVKILASETVLRYWVMLPEMLDVDTLIKCCAVVLDQYIEYAKDIVANPEKQDE